MVAALMEHGLHAWGMYSAEIYEPKCQQNKTKLFLMGTDRPVAEALEPGWAACHFPALILMTEGKNLSSWAAVLWTVPKLHQLPLPFSESYHLLKSSSGSLEGTERTAWNLSITGACGSQTHHSRLRCRPPPCHQVGQSQSRWLRHAGQHLSRATVNATAHREGSLQLKEHL